MNKPYFKPRQAYNHVSDTEMIDNNTTMNKPYFKPRPAYNNYHHAPDTEIMNDSNTTMNKPYFKPRPAFNNHHHNHHHAPDTEIMDDSVMNKPYFKPRPHHNNTSDTEIIDDNINLTTKSIVLDYLYNKIEINDHKYTIIKSIGDIYELQNKKYYVSGNTCGINAFIIFTKKDDSFYSYLVDRRSISYNRNSLKRESVRFTEIKINVDQKLYEGTIFDGIIIDTGETKFISKGDTKSPNIQFMITDVFNLCGKSLISQNYKKKMYIVKNFIDEYVTDQTTSNIDLHISKPYELNDIPTLFQEYIKPNQKKFNIKGLTFYPEFSQSKLIYIFDKQDEKLKLELFSGIIPETFTDSDDNLHLLETSDITKVFKFELMNPECHDNIILNFEMTKISSDVYKLYSIFHHKDKFPEQYIKKSIGIAYIPTYELSLECKMKFTNIKSIIMSCIYNVNKSKWIPIKEADIQKIDIINNEKRLKISQEEVIDQDMLQDDS
ncbi:MAG: hypothetical protein Gaeavirus10_5 [Gaeavirus sp.]|uniref:mRNA capping enzyme adenylation domain-containing protein n=1 Tax=Gaeavirus sp. TaxID=2487767 RepID=A0A3G5A3S7_9VIRU|nr:MAG: hypothetical protein Gaeavirus10_5 [Gaeavirus sp.]